MTDRPIIIVKDNNNSKTEKPSAVRAALTAILKYGVPFIITFALCRLLFSSIDAGEMWRLITTECDFRWMAANVALGIIAHVARAARWQIQLRALGIRSSLWELTLSIFGTYSVNLVFPRLGEVWRTGFIANRRNAPFAEVFGSMIADRFADFVTVGSLMLLTFGLAGPQLADYLTQDPERFAWIVDILTSPVMWTAVAVCAGAAAWVWIKCPTNRIVAAARGMWGKLWEGFAVIGKMQGKGRWLLFTAALWGCYISSTWCAFKSFPLTAELIAQHGATALLVCFVIPSIAMGVPSNGGIGPWQWAMIFAIGLYSGSVAGLTQAYAATFANLVMGLQTLSFILLGIFTFTWIALSKRNKV